MSNDQDCGTNGGRTPLTAAELFFRWFSGRGVALAEVLARAHELPPNPLSEVLMAEMERRWRAGEPVLAMDYLERFPGLSGHPDALHDLVLFECECRKLRGEPPVPEAYPEQFHEIARDLSRLRRDYEADHPSPQATTSRKVEAPLPKVLGYVILRELGRGGMGVVYKARQARPARLVALKMIHAGGHAEPAKRARFLAEGDAIGRLQHVNIVSVFEVGFAGDVPFLSLELVEGGSLAHKLAGKPQPPQWAAARIETLARAVHYAHQRGVIHRDIKPGNVLLTAEDAPKITDFGLARLEQPSLADGDEEGPAAAPPPTLSGMIMGTPSYMAPEQARGDSKEVKAPADVYALGAVLYECLTGRPPFPTKSGGNTVYQVLTEEPEAPRRLNPQVPRDLETICLKCLEKAPEKRYPSAKELADDLRRYVDDEPIHARPCSPWERAKKRIKRNPLKAVSVLAVFLLVIVTVLLGRQFRETTQQRTIRTLSQTFQEGLEQPPRSWTNKHVENLASLVTALSRLDVKQAEAAREKLNVRFTEVVKQRLEVDNLQPEEIKSLEGLIAAYGAIDTKVVTGLTASLDERKHQWTDVFQVTAGHVLENVFDPGWLKEQGNVLVRKAPTRPVAVPASPRAAVFGPSTILSKRICEGNVRLEAIFDGSWKRTDRLALCLNAQQGHTSVVRSVAVSPDGKHLVTAAGRTGQAMEVIVWNLENGTQVAGYQVESRTDCPRIAFSPKDNRLAVVTVNYPIVELLDTTTWQRVVRFEHKGEARCVAFSPDGKILAVGCGIWAEPGEIKLWNLGTNRERAVLRGHTRSIQCLAFSPDGKTLASGGWDSQVRLWDVSSGVEKAAMTAHKEKVLAAAFTPDGKMLATGGTDGVRLWDAATGREQPSRPYLKEAFALAFSPDGKTLGLSNGTLVLLDCEKWQPRPLSGETAGCSALAFSPKDGSLFTGGFYNIVREWDLASGTQRASLHDQGYIFLLSSASPLPDGVKPAPRRAFQDASPESDFSLQIFRNGVPLRPPEGVRASKFPQGRLTLTARREGDQFTFEVNGVATLVFRDTFPLSGGGPGVYGLDLPPEVSLETLRAYRQDLPASPRTFEYGDHLYARRHYKKARVQYRKHSKRLDNSDVHQEARYKEALCLLGLIKQKDENARQIEFFKMEAEELLQELSSEKGHRWPALATCQLWLHYLETKQPAKADEVFRRLDNPAGFEQLVTIVPAGVRDQMLANLRQKTWGINLFQVSPELLPNLQRFDKTLEHLHAAPADRVSNQIALLRAYWLAGRTTEACQVAQHILRRPGLQPVNRIMVLEEYCWILRQDHKPQEALDTLNDTLVTKAGEHREEFLPLLLERARLHVALKKTGEAESDIRTLLARAPTKNRPYRDHTGAYLMLGFLLDKQGKHDAALKEWRSGIRQHNRDNFLADARLSSDFGSLGLLQGLILGSLTGELTNTEASGVVAQCLANGLDVSALGGMGQRVLSALISKAIGPEIFRDMWAGGRARDNARQLAFQDLAMPDYLRTILATGAAAVLRHEVAGDISAAQEKILWELAEAAAQGYFSGTIDKKLLLQMGQAWMAGDGSKWEAALMKLKAKELKGRPCDSLHYFFGHRLLRLRKRPEATKVFMAVREKSLEGSPLRQLAVKELVRLK